MDPERFDALVQSLARPGSRRRLLGGLLAGGLVPAGAAAGSKRHRSHPAGGAGATSHQPAAAKAGPNGPQPAACLTVGKRCTLATSQDARHGNGGKGGKGKHHPPSCNKCCSRFGAAGADGKARCACKPEGDPCDNPSQCCGGLCRDGTCTRCPGALTACDGACVDLQTDDQHCGDCTTACADGQRCVAGRCVCDGTSCPRGCCAKDGTCQRGTDDQACGIDGADCQTCGTCTTCDGTRCVNAAATCCGDASICQGGTCVACRDGQRCKGGACVCDATSCPNGCCAGATCVRFADQTDGQCGTGGQACAACTGKDTCGGGGTKGVCGCTPTTCAKAGKNCGQIPDGCGNMLSCGNCEAGSTTPLCVQNICTACSASNPCPAGCCAGDGRCHSGAGDDACGPEGGACVACGAGRRCVGRQCVCDATSCPNGCCDGNTCNAGTDNGACGKNGDGCVSCQSVCYQQACCTPDRDATTCQGKCGTVRNNCGQEVNCTALCRGCCSGAVCKTGTTNDACGKNGGNCDSCSSPATCYQHACCSPQCAMGAQCGDDDGCGGTCNGTCPAADEWICTANGPLHCCCPRDNPTGATCQVNEKDPTQVCCCYEGGYCRISQSGAACCCSDADRICIDSANGPTCALPPAG